MVNIGKLTANPVTEGQLFDYTNNTSIASTPSCFVGSDIEGLNFERTIDLSNIVVKAMPITEMSSANTEQLVTLETLNFAGLGSVSADMVKNDEISYTNLTPVSIASGYHNETSNDYCDAEDDEEDEDNDDEDFELSGTKRKRTSTVARRAKRFSTASTTSLTDSGASTQPVKKSNKGRKPKCDTNVGSKLLNSNSEELTVARFGNKYVKKGTEEYEIRRCRNNEAVKKCREKTQQKQHEREERLKKLTEENRKLTNTVDSLTKELNVLKNLLIQMNPQNRLPNELDMKLKRLEEMILNNPTNSQILNTAKT